MNILLITVVITSMMLQSEAGDLKPIWNIAHMINNRDQIDPWLGYGANAIEVDVRYYPNGTINRLRHGVPCDILRNCRREDYIGPYLQEIKERATPGNAKYNANLCLIYFDNKITDINGGSYYAAGQNLATEVIKLFSSQIYVMVGIYERTQKEFVKGFYNKISSDLPQYLDRIGYEFSDEKYTNPYTLIDAFESVGITKNIWLSKGVSNWSLKDYKFTNFLEARDNDSTPVTKVYGWTADKQSTMKEWIHLGLDAIITNDPANLVTVLQDASIKDTHRLATPNDNPFAKYSHSVQGCSYHPRWFYYYCWKTCGSDPDSPHWCWTGLYCGADESVCQDPSKQQDCYYASDAAECAATP